MQAQMMEKMVGAYPQAPAPPAQQASHTGLKEHLLLLKDIMSIAQPVMQLPSPATPQAQELFDLDTIERLAKMFK